MTTKHSVDSVAAAAVDRGYLGDYGETYEHIKAMREGEEAPSLVNALWDAIDRELRGERHYSILDHDDAEAKRSRDDLDAIEAYLSGLGLSLNDSDDKIRAALEKEQAERGQSYGQSDRDKGGRDVPVQYNGDVVPKVVVIEDTGPVSFNEAKAAIAGFKNQTGHLADGSEVSFTQARKSLYSSPIEMQPDRRRLIPHLQEIVAGAVVYADAPGEPAKGHDAVFAAAHIRYGGQDMSVRLVLKDVGDAVLRY